MTEQEKQEFQVKMRAEWVAQSIQCPVEGCTVFRPCGVWYDAEGVAHRCCVFCAERLGYELYAPGTVDEDGNPITSEDEDDDCCGYCGGSGGEEPAICRMCSGSGRA